MESDSNRWVTRSESRAELGRLDLAWSFRLETCPAIPSGHSAAQNCTARRQALRDRADLPSRFHPHHHADPHCGQS